MNNVTFNKLNFKNNLLHNNGRYGTICQFKTKIRKNIKIRTKIRIKSKMKEKLHINYLTINQTNLHLQNNK